MRLILLATVVTFILAGSVLGKSTKQNESLEQEVRKVEMAAADAVLRGDLAALEKMWAEDFTVNAPNNQVVKGRAEGLKLFRAGMATYSSFVREIEFIKIYGDTAIVMGLETVKPIGKAPLAGQTVRRRYTNIWMKRKGRWLNTARQASVICQN
ncbi:MAG: nuclear transport factor 2 family protein [Acidobacteriota bacterium]|nr:nuclear transport factor 2 family protein [Acidobacteriota bacterium]